MAGQGPAAATGASVRLIRETPGFGRRELRQGLESMLREAQAEVVRREQDRQEKARLLLRLTELERNGCAAVPEVAKAQRDSRAADGEWASARAFVAVVEWYAAGAAGAVFKAGPAPGDPVVHLRLPGISQRVGGADYFTLRLSGGDALRNAAGEVDAGVARLGGLNAFAGALLVRGSAMPVPLTRETVSLAEPVLRQRAAATAELRRRKAQWAEAQRKRRLIAAAAAKGVANEVELARARMEANLGEAAWREAEASCRLAQLEWARFRTLCGAWLDSAPAAGQPARAWEDPEEVAAELRRRLSRDGCTTASLRELMRAGREAMRSVTAVRSARDRREAAAERLAHLELLDGVREAEREQARLALEVAAAELQGAEEQRLERRLAFDHQAGLCGLDLDVAGAEWSLPNAAVWGKKLAGVEAEVAGHRRDQADIRWRHERDRLEALRPLRESGAVTPYELRSQELTSRMALGGTWVVTRLQERLEVKTGFLELIRAGAQDAGPSMGPLPDAAWELLAASAPRLAAPCPGKLLQLEAARDLVNLRKRELVRLREAGLARKAEVQETEKLSRAYLAMAGAELAKDRVSGAVRDLIGAASAAQAVLPAAGPPLPGRVIEMAPLP